MSREEIIINGIFLFAGAVLSLVLAVLFQDKLIYLKKKFRKWLRVFLHRPIKPAEIPHTFNIGNYNTSWLVIDGDGEMTYSPENIRCLFNDKFVDLPPEIMELREKIDKREKRKQRSGKTAMWNGPFLALEKYAIRRTEDNENMALTLSFCRSDYYTFQATVMSLDENLATQPAYLTLRQKYLNNTDFSEPVTFLSSGFGVSLIVITKDRKMLLTYRDKNLGARPGELDLSVAEGVHPLHDRATKHKGPDLYRTAIRGLQEEIGIEATTDQITFLGFGVDIEYYQWQLLGVVRTEEKSIDIVNKQRRGTGGKWETKHFNITESDPRSVLTILKNEKIWSIGFVCIYWALINEYGRQRVEKEATAVFKR